MESNRWWEFYFVRYFVGSVVGALVIMALAFHPNSELSEVIAKLFDFESASVLNLKSDHFWVILSFGVAFCYIASAPILVIHALRAGIDFDGTVNLSSEAWRNRIIFVSAAILVACLVAWGNAVNILFFLVYNFVIFSQIWLLYPAVKDKFKKVSIFYTDLANERAKNSAGRNQYIESYRHLREHGNAFFIVFFELVLGAVLFSSESLSAAITVLIFWISPALIIWFLGAALESKVKNV
ncbi:TPA: hypothetical protein ACGRV9_005696 [Pseudomonas aeruginosa]